MQRQQFVVRPLSFEFVTAAAQLYHNVWHETQAPLQDARIATFRDNEFFVQRVRDSIGSALVTMDGVFCVGYTGWTENRLDYLFVRGDKRGLGIGRALTNEATTLIKKNGFNKIYLDCIAGNIRARTFYEREGWALEATKIKHVQCRNSFIDCKAWIFVKEI